MAAILDGAGHGPVGRRPDPTPTSHDRLWRPSTLSNLLRNEAYIGRVYSNRTEAVPGPRPGRRGSQVPRPREDRLKQITNRSGDRRGRRAADVADLDLSRSSAGPTTCAGQRHDDSPDSPQTAEPTAEPGDNPLYHQVLSVPRLPSRT